MLFPWRMSRLWNFDIERQILTLKGKDFDIEINFDIERPRFSKFLQYAILVVKRIIYEMTASQGKLSQCLIT